MREHLGVINLSVSDGIQTRSMIAENKNIWSEKSKKIVTKQFFIDSNTNLLYISFPSF